MPTEPEKGDFQEVVSVVLVDRAGRVLMQHRDNNTIVEPGMWTIPGGRLNPGEDPLAGAHRELYEETGLDAELTLAGVLDLPGRRAALVRFHVFAGKTDASQDDVVVGEGQAMVFLTPSEIRQRPLGWVARALLPVALPEVFNDLNG